MMRVNEEIALEGRVRVWAEKDGQRFLIAEQANLIVNNGLIGGADALIGSATLYKVGAGDSNTPEDVNQTDLQGANKYWKEYTERFRSGYTAHVTCYFATNEANFTWRELGLQDSVGRLFARVVLGTPWEKTSSYSATVEWVVTVSRP